MQNVSGQNQFRELKITLSVYTLLPDFNQTFGSFIGSKYMVIKSLKNNIFSKR